MSCMNNIDPYNNAPPPRAGGGGCSSGKCGSKPAAQQYAPPQQVPQYTGRTTSMSQRPQMTPGTPDLQTQNQMLMADLQTAVNYIRQLGGTWPPPGH